MLYSILSQINKGLRRIDILRKSEIGISPQRFEQYSSARGGLVFRPDRISTGNTWFSLAGKTGIFFINKGPEPKKSKKRVQNANMEVYCRRFLQRVGKGLIKKPKKYPGKRPGRNEQQSRARCWFPYLIFTAGRVQKFQVIPPHFFLISPMNPGTSAVWIPAGDKIDSPKNYYRAILSR